MIAAFRSPHAGLVLLILAAAADSTSGLFSRFLSTDGFTTASARGFMAFAFLFGVMVWVYRGRALAALLGIGMAGIAFAVLNAMGMVMNMLSLANTAVANFFMIFATAPFVAAIAARLVLGERLDTPTLLAALAGFAGIAVMMGAGARAGGLLGDVLAFGCVLTYCGLVIVVRKNPGMDLLPAITAAVLTSGLIAAPFADFAGIAARDWGVLAAFAVIQLSIGNLLIFAAMARIPAAQSGLLGILNAAFAPLWVFLAIGEVPPRATLLGGAIILAAAAAHLVWTILAARRNTARPA